MIETISPKEKIPENPKALLDKLVAKERIPEDHRLAVVVAHSDDEVIGIGAQIELFSGCMMVHVTDSASRDPNEWQTRGYSSPEEYGRAREVELSNALDLAGHTGWREKLNVQDQRASFAIADSVRKLTALFEKEKTRYVITHAFEGGHPDHDAVSFSVHAAKKLLAKKGIALDIIEMPLYRKDAGADVWQGFIPAPGTYEVTLPLDEGQRRLKTGLLEAHASQESAIENVSTTQEHLRTARWRSAPLYDFAHAANQGNLARNFAAAGIDAQKWSELAQTALKELGLDDSAL